MTPITSPGLTPPTPLLQEDGFSGMAGRLLMDAGARNSAANAAGPANSADGAQPGHPAKPTPAAIGKAFEEIFSSILVKHMRQSLGTNLFGHDPGDVCGGLFDHFMSHHLAQRGGFGVGRMIQRHLENRENRSEQHEREVDVTVS